MSSVGLITQIRFTGWQLEFKFKEYLILPDEQAFLASDKLRNILILNQSNYDGSIQYMGEGLQLINKVLEIVERELAKDELWVKYGYAAYVMIRGLPF